MDLFDVDTLTARRLVSATDDYFQLEYESQRGTSASEKLFFNNVIVIIATALTWLYGDAKPDPHSPGYLLLMLEQKPKPADDEAKIKQWQANGFGFSLKHIELYTLPEKLSKYYVPGLPRHLDCSGDKAMHVVVSSGSGAGEAAMFYGKVVEQVLMSYGLMRDLPLGYSLHHTSSEHSVTELVEGIVAPRANAGKPTTLLLLSGDGGVVDTVNALMKSAHSKNYVKPVVGLIALGTGNALANSSGLNDDSTKGLSHFLRGTPKVLPAFHAQFSAGSQLVSNEGRTTSPLSLVASTGVGTLYGTVVASWALHAALVADSDTTAYRKHGAARFSMAAKELLAPSDGTPSHAYRGKVTLFKQNDTGQAFPVHWDRDRHMYLLATFVSSLEKGLTISPRSKPLDGKLRLLHFGVLEPEEVGKIFGLAFAGGKHIEVDTVGYESVEGFRVDFDEPEARWRQVCIDGKIVVARGGEKEEGKGAWVEVRKCETEIADIVVLA